MLSDDDDDGLLDIGRSLVGSPHPAPTNEELLKEDPTIVRGDGAKPVTTTSWHGNTTVASTTKQGHARLDCRDTIVLQLITRLWRRSFVYSAKRGVVCVLYLFPSMPWTKQ